MNNREHLICLAALTALVTFSGVARADGFETGFNRIEGEVQSAPATCAQATAFAWFKHQMELTDGVQDYGVEQPLECERTNIASKSEVDAGAYEESK